MASSICFYFQIHQPFRLKRNYNFFDIGLNHQYEDYDLNKSIMEKVARNCYLPTNQLILDLIDKHKGNFKVAFSISGMAIEQFEKYCPEVLESFKKLAQTGCVEFICETYYHSLACIKSEDEFKEQVRMHKDKIKSLFSYDCKTFRNTELIYNNNTARLAEEMGFDAILADGVDRVLEWKSANYLYRPATANNIKLILKNYKLSDDIAFRFSNKSWKDYPLTADKYAKWLYYASGDADSINLFIDYETFGEHHSKDSGILDFFKHLPDEVLKWPEIKFNTPCEITEMYNAKDILDVNEYISWADEARDLSAWLGNSLQNSAFELAYSMEDDVKKTKNKELIHTWRKLLSSDHSYYSCMKTSGDGMIHNYFSPYASAHDAYVTYTNVLNDLKLSVEDALGHQG